MCPRMRLRKSTIPLCDNLRAISIPSSRESPSSQSSSATIRRPTIKSGPTRARIEFNTLQVKRRRLSRDPPHSSLRWLVADDQKLSNR